jgi:phage gp36-like protein
MNYCTQQNLIDAHGEVELIQLTDRVNGIAVDTVVLATALDKADAIINQRLRAKGWTLPLTLTSTDLQQLAKDITRYYLHGHLSEIPKPVQADFDFAIKTLSDYVKGIVDLDIGSPVSMSSANTGAGDVDFSAPARVFTADSLSGF